MFQKIKKYIKKHHSLLVFHFTSKDFFSLFVIVGASIGIPIVIYVNSAAYKEMQFEKALPKSSNSILSSPTAVPADEGDTEVEILANEILIKIKKHAKSKVKENPASTSIDTIDKIAKTHRLNRFEKIAKTGKKSSADADIFDWYLIQLEGENKIIKAYINKQTGKLKKDNHQAVSLAEKIDLLETDPDIENAEPNYVITTTAVPNDPYYYSKGSWGQTYDDLYGLKKINSEGAWEQTTGSTDIVVASIDTGVDRNHEDLASNMWVNTAEIPNNGIDDDKNGYIDDYFGWDFANNDNDPMDDHGHGTHTAGTIAAVGNNSVGVVGVSWNTKIMALKFLTSSGSGATSNAIKALQYAADNGARISSNSWGSSTNSTAMDDAIKYEHDRGMVVVVAAGNSNLDALDHSPASCDGAITVSASDFNDAKASFSNWGEKIDVAAPGVNILSTRASVNPMCTSTNTVGTNYCRVSGTSMAAPHVSGLAALILAKNPALSNEEVRQILRYGADDTGSAGKDIYFGYGRINAQKTLNNVTMQSLSPIITSPRTRTNVTGSSVDVLGTASGGASFASFKVELGQGRTPTSWTTVAQSNSPVSNSTLASIPSSSLAAGSNTIRVIAYDNAGQEFAYQVHDITMPATSPTATPTPAPITTPTVTLQPTTMPSPLPTNTPAPTSIPTLYPTSTPLPTLQPTSKPTLPPGVYPSPTGQANYYTMYGTVTDSTDSTPIAGASIRFNERHKNASDGKLVLSVYSDSQGNYIAKLPAEKLYTNTVTVAGYKTFYNSYLDTRGWDSGHVRLLYYRLTPLNATATPIPAPTKASKRKNAVKNVRASKIDRTAVTVSWTTIEQSTRQIRYGTSPNKLNLRSAAGMNLRYAHSLTLTKLKRNTRYFYRVYSKNARGQEVSSPTMTFITKR